MYLGFANLSKPAMKSKYFGLLLGRWRCLPPVYHGCYWGFCIVLPAPLEMTGTEGLEQYKEGSISSFYSLMLIAVQTASLLTWAFCWRRELILYCTVLGRRSFPLCDQLKFQLSTLLSCGSVDQNYRQAQSENS